MCDHDVSFDDSHHASHDASHDTSHDVGHHEGGHVSHHHHGHSGGHHESHRHHSHNHYRSGQHGGAQHDPAGFHGHRHHDACHRHHRHHHRHHGAADAHHGGAKHDPAGSHGHRHHDACHRHDRRHHRHHRAADDELALAFGYVEDAVVVLPATHVQQPQRRPRRSELVVIGGGAFPRIDKISIHLPSDSIVHQGSVTYFSIDVVPQDPAETSWRVLRRYSQFHALRDKINVVAAFPNKHFFWCKGWKLEARREGLQAWLQAAVSSPTACLRPALRKFLLVGRSPIPFSDMPQPSAPPPQDDDGLILLLVELPAHVGFGDVIAVEVPNGKVAISVPFGLSPGKPLQLWYDPTAGSLALHHEQQWQALHDLPQQ